MKLIPEWKWIIAKLNLAPKMIPQDISMHWNSTFDMLDMALEYQKGVIAMTERQQNGLHDLELSDNKWDILGKLCDILKVTVTVTHTLLTLQLSTCRFSRMQHCFSLGVCPASQL